MNKLPELYKKENPKIQDHNKKVCHLKIEENDKEIQEVLDSIFHGYHHPFTVKVFIKTKEDSKETYLVSKRKDTVLTIDNEEIPISSIIYIKRIS